MKKLYLITAILFLISNILKADWSHDYGIFGGEINDMAKNGNYIYAGLKFYSVGGLYFSTNNGATWSQSSLNDRTVYSIAVSGNKIFAGAGEGNEGGVWFSTNNGINWSRTSLSNWVVYDMIVIENFVLAGTSVGVYYSSDNGVNWILSNLTSEVEMFSVDLPRIFAATYGGLYCSTNNGINWTRITTYGGTVISVAANGNNIIIGTRLLSIPPHTNMLYRSTDNGSSWIQTSINGDSYAQSLAVSGNNVYAGVINYANFNYSGFYYSPDNGASWSLVGTKHREVNSIIISDKVYACTDGGLFSTTNNGLNWNQFGIYNLGVTSLTAKNNFVFAGTATSSVACGIFMSTNYSSNWTCTDFNNHMVSALTVCGNYIFAASPSMGIYRTSNDGMNWTQTFNSSYPYAFAVSGSNIYTGAFTTGTGGVFLSTNYGTNWTLIGLDNLNIRALALSGNIIYAGDYSYGVYKSTNSGANWIQTSLNNKHVYSLLISGNNVFAGCGSSYGVYMTTNGGVNWTQTSLNNTQVNAFVESGNKIIAGSINGVYITSNNGVNWVQKNEGFLGTVSVNAFYSANGILFAGTGSGVWRRPLPELVGIENSSQEIPGEYSLYQNYPNPFNPVTTINYDLPVTGFARLVVYDILGKEIELLVSEKQTAGKYKVTWDASDYPSGVYFYSLTAAEYSETKKMVLIK